MEQTEKGTGSKALTVAALSALGMVAFFSLSLRNLNLSLLLSSGFYLII